MTPLGIVLRLTWFGWRYFVANTTFAIVNCLLVPLALGLATRAFFDAVSGASAGLNVWSAIVIIVAVQLGDVLAAPLLLGVPWSPLQMKAQALLQQNLLAGILRGYGRHGLPTTVGETISNFRDDPAYIADALDALSDLIGRSLFAAISAVVMWQVNPTVTVAIFVPLLLSSFIAEALEGRILAVRRASREATGRVTGFLGELIGAQLAVKVAGGSSHAVARLVELGERRRKASVRDSVFEVTLDAFNHHVVHMGTGLVLLVGATAIGDGTFTVGDLALFVVFLDQLTWFPAEAGRMIRDLKQIVVSRGRLEALVPGESAAALVAPAELHLDGGWRPVAATRQPDRLERLEVRGLSYRYPGTEGGVADVSFALERGSFTVVTGRIGSGKTTLLAALLGLVPVQAGEVWWNGRLVGDLSSYFVPPRAAYAPQVPRLFSETLRENLLLGLADDDAAVMTAIRSAVLDMDAAALPHGLDTSIGPRGVKLSGGQVHRAATARALVRQPELLVVDDVSSALDVETEQLLWERIAASGRTVLVVSHRPAALRRADQVLLMEGGRLAATGTLEELLERSGEMQRLWQRGTTR